MSCIGHACARHTCTSDVLGPHCTDLTTKGVSALWLGREQEAGVSLCTRRASGALKAVFRGQRMARNVAFIIIVIITYTWKRPTGPYCAK